MLYETVVRKWYYKMNVKQQKFYAYIHGCNLVWNKEHELRNFTFICVVVLSGEMDLLLSHLQRTEMNKRAVFH